ncbi:MAG: acetylxylan esterase [Planctomycetes bacterium]|nr:acetylxylan esterase [Planctomycetota bacterium]
MKPTLRCVLILATACSFTGGVAAQSDSPKPFAEYPERTAKYLQRLHITNSVGSKGTLSFREDFPGGFAAWQVVARAELEKLLGLDTIREATESHKPVVMLGRVTTEDGYTRQRGDIQTEPGITIPFWLLRPVGRSSKPRPLAICSHGHNPDGWNTYAGVYSTAEHREKTLEKDGDPGVQSARRGFVTLVPATRGLAEATQLPDLKGRHGDRECRVQLIHCLLAGRTAVGERVWDVQRLLDWALDELNGVDQKKVVLLGNSGGGVLTVYAAALDERITVAVPSCSFTSYTSDSGFIFHCDCCLVPRAQAQLGDMADIGALTAPRSLLAVHGRKDGLHSYLDVERAMARVRSIYQAAGASDQFRNEWGAEGHKFYPDIMWPFIESALGH